MYNVKVIRSNRKTSAIEIKPSGEVIFRCNYFMPQFEIEKIVRQNEGFILSHLEKLSNIQREPEWNSKEKEAHREHLREYVTKRAEYYSKEYGFNFGKITITSAKTRFGSCSGRNNISFSLFLDKFPEELIDYVIVHELCHTKEHNHSKKFYSLVNSIMPDWKERQNLLKNSAF